MYFAFVEKPNNKINPTPTGASFLSSTYVAQVI
jgi:hypothetical protein